MNQAESSATDDNLYEILHLTKNNQLVAIKDSSIVYLDLRSGDVISTVEPVDTQSIFKCKKGFVFSLTQNQHTLEMFKAQDFSEFCSLDLGDELVDVYDVVADGSKVLVQTKNGFALWDTRGATKIISFDPSLDIYMGVISEDGIFIAFIKNDNSIHIYDVNAQAARPIETDFYFQYNLWDKDLWIDKAGEDYKLFVSGPLFNGEQKANLLIVDMLTNKTLAHSIVSPTTRVPGVTHIMSVSDKHVVLCAMYGYMGRSYTMWLADKNSGIYIRNVSPENGGTICEHIDSLGEYLLITESMLYSNDKQMEFVDIENELTQLLEPKDKTYISFRNYKHITKEGAFGDSKRKSST
jgi:hypothetical protein